MPGRTRIGVVAIFVGDIQFDQDAKFGFGDVWEDGSGHFLNGCSMGCIYIPGWLDRGISFLTCNLIRKDGFEHLALFFLLFNSHGGLNF